MNTRFFLPLLLTAGLSLALTQSLRAAAIVRSVGGDSTQASVAPTRNTFRLDLGGGTTAGANGSFGGVRREINWDDVPAPSAAPNNLAGDFFNTTSPRGVLLSTPGTGFQVSSSFNDNGPGQPVAADFGNINSTYTAAFGEFTPERIFTPVGSNITDVTFFIAGSAQAASVKGFGAMFTDVDTVGSTTLEMFDPTDVSLGTFMVPKGTQNSGSFSFLGVFFNAAERIGRVRITSGSAALATNVSDNPAGGTDLVVMDDFLFSEPNIPEPSALFLGLLGIGICLAHRGRPSR